MHIHQGGTLNTYCGQPLTLGTNLSWADAHKATCLDCHKAYFPAQSAAERYHGSNQFGR